MSETKFAGPSGYWKINISVAHHVVDVLPIVEGDQLESGQH